MAIRNTKLGGTNWVEEGLKPLSDLNDTFDATIDKADEANTGFAELALKNLKDNNIFTNGGTMAADEYTDSTGLNDTVNTGSSTAVFDTDGYVLPYTSSADDTTYDPNSVSNPSYAFDRNLSTIAYTNVVSVSSTNKTLGKTFSERLVGNVKVIASAYVDNGSYDEGGRIELMTYNGSIWSSVATLANNLGVAGPGVFYAGVYNLNATVQGVAIKCSTSSTSSGSGVPHRCEWYELEHDFEYTTDKEVVCDTNTVELNSESESICLYNDAEFPTSGVSDNTPDTEAHGVNLNTNLNNTNKFGFQFKPKVDCFLFAAAMDENCYLMDTFQVYKGESFSSAELIDTGVKQAANDLIWGPYNALFNMVYLKADEYYWVSSKRTTSGSSRYNSVNATFPIIKTNIDITKGLYSGSESTVRLGNYVSLKIIPGTTADPDLTGASFDVTDGVTTINFPIDKTTNKTDIKPRGALTDGPITIKHKISTTNTQATPKAKAWGCKII